MTLDWTIKPEYKTILTNEQLDVIRPRLIRLIDDLILKIKTKI